VQADLIFVEEAIKTTRVGGTLDLMNKIDRLSKFLEETTW